MALGKGPRAGPELFLIKKFQVNLAGLYADWSEQKHVLDLKYKKDVSTVSMLFTWALFSTITAEVEGLARTDGFDTGKPSLLGLDAKKLFPERGPSEDYPEIRPGKKPRDTDDEASMSYNMVPFAEDPEKEKSSRAKSTLKKRKAHKEKTQGRKKPSKKSRDGKKTRDGKKARKGPVEKGFPPGEDRDSMMMATQANYEPMSKLLLKKAGKEDPKKEATELMRNNEDVSSLLAQASSLVNRNRELVSSLMADKKDSEKDSQNPKYLFDYKVIEVNDGNGK